jgi:ABC-2 type transport system ATP-binding protein
MVVRLRMNLLYSEKEEIMRKRHRLLLSVNGLRVRRNAKFEINIPFLVVTPGTVTCIVGANGSGKTTFVESLVGLLPPIEGEVRINGDIAHSDNPYVKRAIGYVPDDDSWIIPELTAREYFELLMSVQLVSQNRILMRRRVDQMSQELMLTSIDQQLGQLSHGNKKKVQIIAGLLHDPHFIIVDELRNGLDPIAIIRAEALLKARMQSGSAIIAATHDLWWAERFADEIVMIRRGQIILREATESIVSHYGSVESRFMELYDDAAVAK